MKDKVLVWDVPVRAFHWLLAGSFAVAYLLGDSERSLDIHVMLGYTVLGLIAFRLVWGFAGTGYARFRSFAFGPGTVLAYVRSLARGNAPHYTGHNPAGSLAIWSILALAALTVAAGWLTFNELGGDAAEDVHELLANAWLAVVGVHVAGVAISSLLHRENLARAMLTGYKRAEPPDGIRRSAAGLGALVVLAVVGFWTWSLAAPARAPSADQAVTAIGQDQDHDD
jgi:cytochrome b